MSLLQLWKQLPSAAFQTGKKKITKFLFLLLLLFFRPDLRKKMQSKQRLAEVLRSEYASGMEAGGAKVAKQSQQAGQAAGQAVRPRPEPGLGRGRKQKKKRSP